MNVSFVVPSWHYLANPFKIQPYWELYYATILRDKLSSNAKVDLIDLRGLKSEDLQDQINSIEQKDFYCYWILKSGDAIEIYSLAKILKKKYPNSIHIAGGTHVDKLPDECEKHFDHIIVGPGENNFYNAIINKDKKKYIDTYKNVSFESTPYPDRSLLPYKNIISNEMFTQYGDMNATMLYFSRGCFYRCSYCVYNTPNMLQARSKKMMIDELNHLKNDYKVEAVLLKDEIAINPKKQVYENQIEAFGQSGLKWRGQTTSIATYEQLKLAKDSGCMELAVGVETVDDNVMKTINKQWQNQDTIRRFIENAKKAEIKIKICLILGLPGEPEDITKKTISFLSETKPDYVAVSGFCPIPGSPIFMNPEKYGIKTIDNDWSKHAHLLFRFAEEEEVGIPFEYSEDTPWGRGFTKSEIVNNIKELQSWLNNNSMVY